MNLIINELIYCIVIILHMLTATENLSVFFVCGYSHALTSFKDRINVLFSDKYIDNNYNFLMS